MPELVKQLGDWAVWVAGVIGALTALWRWVAKPIRDIRDDTGDLMCDRLSQAHDYWIRKGYCPPADLARLVAMHQRYKAMGRNHLMESYEQDLLELPPERPATNK